jgi:hypothetical protein
LLDESGAPYDLSGSPTIKWILFDYAHNHIVIVGDPKDGIVSIIIPSPTTARIAGGLYSDTLRLSVASDTAMLSMGAISVIANPTAEPFERFGQISIADLAR